MAKKLQKAWKTVCKNRRAARRAAKAKQPNDAVTSVESADCNADIQSGTSDSVTVTCGRGSEGGGEGVPDGIGEELKGELLSKPADDGCECPSGPHLRDLHLPAGESPLGLPPLATGRHT